MPVQVKLIWQLKGSVRKTPNAHVNFLIVDDHVFEMEPEELMSKGPEEYPDIPAKKGQKGFDNLIEFLLFPQWELITASDMNNIIDKIESSISIEWHIYRGLQISSKELKNGKFAMSVSPYLGLEFYKQNKYCRNVE